MSDGTRTPDRLHHNSNRMGSRAVDVAVLQVFRSRVVLSDSLRLMPRLMPRQLRRPPPRLIRCVSGRANPSRLLPRQGRQGAGQCVPRRARGRKPAGGGQDRRLRRGIPQRQGRLRPAARASDQLPGRRRAPRASRPVRQDALSRALPSLWAARRAAPHLREGHREAPRPRSRPRGQAVRGLQDANGRRAEAPAAAGTSHTAISRLESGTHTPNLVTLQKIAAVLDEELLVCFQRTVDGEVERDFAAVA